MKLIAATVAISLSAATAQAKCYHVEEAFTAMQSGGYQITFGGIQSGSEVYVAQRGNGDWLLFEIEDEELCFYFKGDTALNFPLPPNT